MTTWTWNCRSYLLYSCAISCTNHAKGNLWKRSSVLSDTGRSHGEPPSLAGTFGASLWDLSWQTLWGAFPPTVGLAWLASPLVFLRVLPPLPSGLVAMLETTQVTFPPLLASLPPLFFFLIPLVKGVYSVHVASAGAPSSTHPQHHLCSSHSGMEKQPIRDCGRLFKGTPGLSFQSDR